jgi:predicted DCC family thiol-disulfide oxidoreductase YuxK
MVPAARTNDVPPFLVTVFFDGECPLCLREIRLLRRMDRRGRINFVDIARPDFDGGAVGLPREVTHADLMAEIHGLLPDGTVIRGVEVFRRLYAAVGLGALVAITRVPGISHLLDGAYRLFARNRLRLTGRCADGACAVHGRGRPPHDSRGPAAATR